MKDKLKDFLLYSFILYAIIIVTSIAIKYFSYSPIVKIDRSIINIESVDKYEKELKTLEQNECTDYLKEYIQYYKSTTYGGDFDIKKYNDTYNISEITLGGICKTYLNDEEFKMLSNNVTTLMYSKSTLMNKHIYKYELYFKDKYYHNQEIENDDETTYKLMKDSEYNIISLFVNAIKKGSDNNEQ